ncbi:MAG: fimbrillin family protein [Bacteroidaceae bacterium]|nr:fimbrillin family protein [Bacteroidaceae bacterium]
MKKYFYFLLFALTAMVFTGCSSDDDFTPDTPEGETFTASIEEASRTMLNGRKVTWIEGDAVNFATTATTLAAPYSVTPLGDGSMGLLSPTGTNTPKTPYEAYYPESIWAKNEQGKYSSALNYRQDYESENNISKVNPMYATSETTYLTFKNICGMLRLKLKGTAKISRIMVSDGDHSLSGSFSLNNDMAVISSTSEEMRTGVYLNCGEGIQLTPEGTDFCISIPAGRTYNKLVIKVYDTEDGYYTMRISNATVDRNNIYTIEKTPKFKPVPAPVMPGAFSVSNDDGKTIRKVYFSRGNMYWDAIREQFDLEVNQQDYSPVPLRGYWSVYDPTHVSHLFYTQDPEKAYGLTYDTSKDTKTDTLFAHGMEMYGTKWQVLTENEWKYLFTRKGNGKYLFAGKAVEIDNEYVIGMFLYPDDYVGNKDEDTWKEIEDAHIVILPVSGGARSHAGDGSTIASIGQQGTYMANKLRSNGSTGGYYFKTINKGKEWTKNTIAFGRGYGLAIRLVTEENPNEK